ncbi:MAG: saccharopine dehydrogenase NADP-binding domain-containing protein [bacterium]
MNKYLPKKPSIVLLGATGCVGRILVNLLDRRHDINLTLAGRNMDQLNNLSLACKHPGAIVQVDLDKPGSLSEAVQDTADTIINCTGRYRENGLHVAQTAAEHGLNLIDIADEPVYLQEVVSLDALAKAHTCSLIIGSGTAPQTTGALIKSSLEIMGHGVDVKLGICFGINKVGLNAIRTATEAVGGLIALKSMNNIWQKGALIDFQKPFSRLWVRHYPLPETVYLPAMEGVDTWLAGVCLSSPFLNTVVAMLRHTGLAQKLASSRLPLRLFCSINSLIETGLSSSRRGNLGIALHVEVRQGGKARISYLYHYDMAELTAQAAAITLDHLLRTGSGKGGVYLAHNFMDSNLFLKHLEASGIVWSLMEVP